MKSEKVMLSGIKILQVGKFYPPVRGGIETVTNDIVEELAGKGATVDVLCFNANARTVVESQQNGTGKIVRAGVSFTVASQPFSFAYFLYLFRHAGSYNIIHVHLPNPFAFLAVAFMPRHVKLVLHWHSDIVKQRFLKILIAPFQWIALRRASSVIATSNAYLQASTVLRKIERKVSVIPIGINPMSAPVESVSNGRSAEDLRREYGGQFIVFSLGRLIYYKGFEYLIQAASHLPDNYTVVIGGDGHLRDQLESQIALLGLSKRVILAGSISNVELPAHFQMGDVFCLPSIERSEAFGVVLLEAMSFAKPIVATKIAGSGVAWVNQDGESGINVDPRNPIQLANAIKHICEQPNKAAEYGQGAKKRFLTQFTAAHMGRDVARLYWDLTWTSSL